MKTYGYTSAEKIEKNLPAIVSLYNSTMDEIEKIPPTDPNWATLYSKLSEMGKEVGKMVDEINKSIISDSCKEFLLDFAENPVQTMTEYSNTWKGRTIRLVSVREDSETKRYSVSDKAFPVSLEIINSYADQTTRTHAPGYYTACRCLYENIYSRVIEDTEGKRGSMGDTNSAPSDDFTPGNTSNTKLYSQILSILKMMYPRQIIENANVKKGVVGAMLYAMTSGNGKTVTVKKDEKMFDYLENLAIMCINGYDVKVLANSDRYERNNTNTSPVILTTMPTRTTPADQTPEQEQKTA